jgi:hypothetical protein
MLHMWETRNAYTILIAAPKQRDLYIIVKMQLELILQKFDGSFVG